MSDIHKVLVLGTGVLGAQIAFQMAYHGFSVTAYDIDDAALTAAKGKFAGLVGTYQAAFPHAAPNAAHDALARIGYSCDLSEAGKDVDLVIEAVPEILKLKREVFAKLNDVAPQHTIFATNSSSLLPSAIADATGRPDRFLAMHFANMVWQFNTVEIMGTPQTSAKVFDTVVDFVGQFGMVAIPIKKEVAGYVLNSLLIPFLNAALSLAAGGYAEPKVVDEVWRIDTGAPLGPFQIYDVIGLNTPYNILVNGSERDKKLAAWLKEHYIDQGRTGAAAGAGFYEYHH